MKNIIKLIFFICLISILQFSCSIKDSDSKTRIKPKIPLSDGNWIILDTPNDLDCPGRIFAYNKSKDKIIPITTLKVNKITEKLV